MKCADVIWDMKTTEGEPSAADAQPGDLLWQPKGGEGHVLSDRTETVTYGWVTVEERQCECGRLDLSDHHVFLLAPLLQEQPE